MRSNLNTILLSITLLMLGWVGKTVYETSIAVATLSERLVVNTRDIIDLRNRVSDIERVRGAYRGMSQARDSQDFSSPGEASRSSRQQYLPQ